MQSNNAHAAIHDCLSIKHSMLASQWIKKFPPSAATGLPIQQQLQTVNSFWRIILGRLEVDTVAARDALVDNISLSTWIRDFQKYVLPVIAANVNSL